MHTKDGIELQALLQRSASEFQATVAGVSDEEANYKSQPQCWSILEVVEHVVLVDMLSSRRIAKTEPVAEKIENADREQLISNKVSSREAPISAPAISHPQGKFSTVADALSDFEQGRARVLKVLAEREDSLRYLPIAHPVFGTISGYDCFLLIAAHTQRHRNQIREIRGLLSNRAANGAGVIV
jgi:hypothetical protein